MNELSIDPTFLCPAFDIDMNSGVDRDLQPRVSRFAEFLLAIWFYRSLFFLYVTLFLWSHTLPIFIPRFLMYPPRLCCLMQFPVFSISRTIGRFVSGRSSVFRGVPVDNTLLLSAFAEGLGSFRPVFAYVCHSSIRTVRREISRCDLLMSGATSDHCGNWRPLQQVTVMSCHEPTVLIGKTGTWFFGHW